MERKAKILGISGSLRARSSNTELLKAAATIASDIADINLWSGLDTLPHYNPDHDAEGAELPESVNSLRAEIKAADALLISTPEYAHGLPGSLKNALDWLVSGPEMVGKPIGVLNASSRSVHAQAQLQEILRTMSVNLVTRSVALVPMDGRRLDASGVADQEDLAAIVRNAVSALAATVGQSIRI